MALGNLITAPLGMCMLWLQGPLQGRPCARVMGWVHKLCVSQGGREQWPAHTIEPKRTVEFQTCKGEWTQIKAEREGTECRSQKTGEKKGNLTMPLLRVAVDNLITALMWTALDNLITALPWKTLGNLITALLRWH